MSFDKKSFVPIRESDTIIFYINTGPFPLRNETYSKMWDFAKELQPSAAEEIDKISNKNYFNESPCIPQTPFNFLNNPKLINHEKIEKINEYIQKLQYNHTGMQFFDIRKDRPIAGLMDIAKKMIEDSLPIKCLEAVILSIYLTNELSSVERFSIGFKTISNGNIHRHVVLGIYCHNTSQFGALGTSRRSDLGYKPIKYNSLTELIQSFIDSYAIYLHKVKRVRVGMPIPNSIRSYESIQWNGVQVNPTHKSQEWIKYVEKQSRNIRIYNCFGEPGVEIKKKIRNNSETLNNLNEIIEPNVSSTIKRVPSLVSTPIKNAILLTKRKNNSLRI